MSLSALQHPLSDNKLAALPAPDAANPDIGDDGYLQWLTWLQKLLSANTLALYGCYQGPSGSEVSRLTIWPADAEVSPWSNNLASRAAHTRAVVQANHKDDPARSVVCLPHGADSNTGHIRHVLVVERDVQSAMDRQTQARLVTWAFESLGRFHDTSRKSDSVSPADTFAQCAVVLAAVSEAEQCVIAKLPVKRGRAANAQLLAVSGQPRVDARLAASQALVQAINQAYKDQAVPVKAIIEHDAILADARQGERLLLPVRLINQWFVVSLERNSRQSFNVSEQIQLENLCRSHLSIVLLADPDTLGVRAAITRRVAALRAKRVEFLSSSVLGLGIGMALLLWLLYPVEHRVSAPLSVEAAEQHVLIAPVNGFVKSVVVSAGDRVRKGQTLATLDDQELQLQVQKLNSEGMQNQQAYSQVLAAHNRVEVTRLKEEDVLIQTELSQLNLKAEKMILKAPVDGVVLSGNWEDFLGAAVAAGDTLFALGSDSSHRLVLDVSEYDVSRVKPDQPVAIRLAADPSSVLMGRITAIMPLTVANAGVNSVQVHAMLEQGVQLRPGMQGIGKVRVGRKSRLMQWYERAAARFIWLGWKLGVLR